MTQKTSCHLPFDVEGQKLGMRRGTVVKTRIWGRRMHLGLPGDKRRHERSTLGSSARDASVLGISFLLFI